MGKPRIAFAMIEAGGGHKMPALAIYESLNRLFPRKYDLRVLDFMKDLGCVDLDKLHKAAWKYMLKNPNLIKGIQTFDFITGPVNIQLYKLAGSSFYPYVLRFLKNERPDLIFSTHFFNTMAVSYVRRHYRLNPLLVNFLSEIFDFDSYWYLRNVDHYIVTSERAQRKLLRRRFPRSKLHLFPYPVRESFFAIERSREEILEELGLEPGRKTRLVTMGSEGIGAAPVARQLAALVRRDLELNIVVVAGRNARLRRQMEVEFGGGTGKTRLVSLGFVDHMNELISASDFCFIKPGPATTWEVLSLRRPILFTTSAQLSENPNIRYAVRHQVGFYAGLSPLRLVRLIRYLMDEAVLRGIQASYDQLRLENGADAIARFVDGLLRRRGAQ
jgi:UDP-N-acetylglucosamine:LPS N-acetylglucosamine transferase